MKYFIVFIFLFLTNCLVPAAMSATINDKKPTILSDVKVAKKLNFRERIALKYLVFKAALHIEKDAILPLTLGTIFLVLGLLLLISFFTSGGIAALILCLISLSIGLVLFLGGLADSFGCPLSISSSFEF